jgi:peptidoglycan/LPS O-acetylase OafA/YrhL
MRYVMGSKDRFEALDLLRGLAAVAVVALHAPRPDEAESLLPHAYLAVDLFFGLSGFVITHAYWQRLRDGMTVQSFLVERLIRLYPLYLLAIVVGAILVWNGMQSAKLPELTPADWITTIGANLLFLPAPPSALGSDSPLFPLAFPAWSLFWELIANVAFAGAASRLTPRMLGRLLAIALCLLLATAAFWQNLNVGVVWSGLSAGAARVLWSFFAGVALYMLYQSGKFAMSARAWVLGAVLILSLLQPPMDWSYDFLLVAFLFPLLVFAGARAQSNSSAARWLAQISYAVYLLQAPLLLILEELSPGLISAELNALSLPLTTAMLIAAALAVGTIATRYYDEPVRAWLRLFLIRRNAQQDKLASS